MENPLSRENVKKILSAHSEKCLYFAVFILQNSWSEDNSSYKLAQWNMKISCTKNPLKERILANK